MKSNAIALLFACVALPALAEPETFTLDPNHSFTSFEYKHLGVSTQRGRFTKTTGKVTVDTAAKTGTADVVIDAGSVDVGPPRLTEHLRSADFFDAAKYPNATFQGTSFTFDGDKVKTVTGNLTIMGTTKPVTLDTVFFNCTTHPQNKKKLCGGDFTATIKRSEFGMTRAIPAVSDEITLRISVEATKD